MDTLYDLLGALPRDDADELRTAFRNAVKGAHPDLNPGDPLAGQKFREIVRANEILTDQEQRDAYDHLLHLAHKEQRQRMSYKTLHKAAASVVVLGIVAGLGLGAYLAQEWSPEVSSAMKHVTDTVLVRPGDFASLPSPAAARTEPAPAVVARTEAVPAAAADTKIHVASAEPPAVDKPQTVTDAIVPIVVTSTTVTPRPDPDNSTTASVGPPLNLAPGDSKASRERGIFAYRSGDLDGAIAEFDRAIRLDPTSAAAYVDRGIVLYRLQRFERAFADIAQAKRLERTRAAKAAAAAAARKPRGPLAQQAPQANGYQLFPRRTARLEASTP
jgi:tetratricopeptide (TPR) repeat protein